MPLYDVWWKAGGGTKPVDQQWKRLAQIEVPLPYWGAPQSWEVFHEAALRPLFEVLHKERAFRDVPVVQLRPDVIHTHPVSMWHYTLQARRGLRRQQVVVAPPYNVVYDLRLLPNGNDYGGDLVLSLPGFIDAHSDVMQGWPWTWNQAIPLVDIDAGLPEVRVAIDQALERGLAGFGLPFNDIAYDLTNEHSELGVFHIAFFHQGPSMMWDFPGAYVERLLVIPAGYETGTNRMRVSYFAAYFAPGIGKAMMNRTGYMDELLNERHVQLIDTFIDENHETANLCIDFWIRPETVENLRVWIDDQLQRGNWRPPEGSFSGTLVRKKEPRNAIVRETKQQLRTSAMPFENVIGFKMPAEYRILTRSGAAETYYLYAFDTEQNANAYHEGLHTGTKKFFTFPSRSYGRQNPITDVWAKWNKPPKGCIGIFHVGVFEDEGTPILFVDMMSVRPEWQRYGVNTAMLLYMQMRWPGRTMTFSDTTHAGHAYAEWWRSQGRQVEEQNAKFWERSKKTRLLP